MQIYKGITLLKYEHKKVFVNYVCALARHWRSHHDEQKKNKKQKKNVRNVRKSPCSLHLLSPLLFFAGDFLARVPPILVCAVVSALPVTPSEAFKMRSSSEALVSSVLKPHPMSNGLWHGGWEKALSARAWFLKKAKTCAWCHTKCLHSAYL